jgi:serine/threonine protein kinase
MSENRIYKLKVNLIAARGLVPFTCMGRYEIGCVVKIGSVTHAIKPSPSFFQKFKNTNPIFNQTFHFDVDPLKDVVFIQFIDTDDFNVENKIGDVTIPLAGLQRSVENKRWYKVEHATSGEVNVALTALDFDTTTAGANSDGVAAMPLPLQPVYGQVQGLIPAPLQPPPLAQQFPLPPSTPPLRINDKSNESPPLRADLSDRNRFDESHKPLTKFSPEDIQRQFPHIAKGTFGVVFKGTVRGVSQTVVIKDMEIHNARNVEDWKRELQLMSQNRCPYVVDVLGYCANGNILTIIMEYMENGSLYDLIHVKRTPLSLLQRLRMARHCALGLAHLHNKGILHRDVKSMNILVSKDFSCKLTDFGCAKLIDPGRQLYNTANSGTPLWMAPEVKRGVYSFSADIYSLGLVLYEIFEYQLPYYDLITQSVHLPAQFQSAPVVRPCVSLRPDSRPTAVKVVNVLNQMIRNVLEKVKDVLPPEDIRQIRSLGDAQKLIEAKGNDDTETGELSDIYRYLLCKDPIYVDTLINRAYSGNFLSPSLMPAASPSPVQGPPPYPFAPPPPPHPSPQLQAHLLPQPPPLSPSPQYVPSTPDSSSLDVSFPPSPSAPPLPRQQFGASAASSYLQQPPPYNVVLAPSGAKETPSAPQHPSQPPPANNVKGLLNNNNQPLIPLLDIAPKANAHSDSPPVRKSPNINKNTDNNNNNNNNNNSGGAPRKSSKSTAELIDFSSYNVKDSPQPSSAPQRPHPLQLQIQPPVRADQPWVIILNDEGSIKYVQQKPIYPKHSDIIRDANKINENDRANERANRNERHSKEENIRPGANKNAKGNGNEKENESGSENDNENESKISRMSKAIANLFKRPSKKPNIEKAKRLYATYQDDNATGISHERAISALTSLFKNRADVALIRTAVNNSKTPLITLDMFLQLYSALWFQFHQESL